LRSQKFYDEKIETKPVCFQAQTLSPVANCQDGVSYCLPQSPRAPGPPPRRPKAWRRNPSPLRWEATKMVRPLEGLAGWVDFARSGGRRAHRRPRNSSQTRVARGHFGSRPPLGADPARGGRPGAALRFFTIGASGSIVSGPETPPPESLNIPSPLSRVERCDVFCGRDLAVW